MYRALFPFLVASMLAVCGCAQPAAPMGGPARPSLSLDTACRRKPLHLAIVGDSLARGWGASTPAHSFANLVYVKLRRGHPRATLTNLGIPGATSEDIARKEVPKLRNEECTAVVVIAGANDVQKLYTPGRFRRSYEHLLRTIRHRVPSAAIVVIGLPDVALSPLIPIILKPAESYLSRADNVSIAAAARENRSAFVPMYDVSHNYANRTNQLLSRDGIHPNDAGYEIMAGTALPAIMDACFRSRR